MVRYYNIHHFGSIDALMTYLVKNNIKESRMLFFNIKGYIVKFEDMPYEVPVEITIHPPKPRKSSNVCVCF